MGVKVKRNKKSGKLAFRIFWNVSEWLELGDNRPARPPENRKLVEAQALLIDNEIKRGKFDYLKWFPFGNQSDYFAGRREKTPESAQEYFDRWIEDKKPPFVRKSSERDYRQHWDAILNIGTGAGRSPTSAFWI